MTILINTIPFFPILFQNPYLLSVLGFVAFALVAKAFSIISS